jgi:hypothetical protein
MIGNGGSDNPPHLLPGRSRNGPQDVEWKSLVGITA